MFGRRASKVWVIVAFIACVCASFAVAWAQSTSPAYYVAELSEVTDPEALKTNRAAARDTVEKYGGTYLVLGGTTESLEGQPASRIVTISFKSLSDARKWYNSPEYSAVRPIRQRSAKSRTFLVEGSAP
jgi:uncharacterized protein (DUF1330 family)